MLTIRGPGARRAASLAAMSWLTLATASLCHAQPSPGLADAGIPLSAAANDDATLSELIDDLGSAYQDEREAATEQLMRSGASLDAPAWKAHLRANRFEVRRRVKQIMRELFLTQRLGPPPAFLGIGYVGYPSGPPVHGRVPAGSTALLITSIVPWSAASRAGLQRRDLVVALNSFRFLPPDSPLDIPPWIKNQPLGTTCRLGVIRGGTGRVLNDDDPPGFDPRAFSKIEMEVVTADADPRLTPGSVALRITDIARADARLALASGDLLVALDGEPLPADEPLDRLGRWAAGDWVGQPAGGVQAPVPPGPRPGGRRATGPSAQILRGGEYVTLEAVLGRRPTHLAGPAA